jgi:signal transduction histidine kinase
MLMWVLLVALLPTQSAAGVPFAFERALFLLSDSPTPPAEGAGSWEPIALPDYWRRMRPEVGGTGWYRFTLPRAAAAERWAVYLPSANMNAKAWVNGVPVGSGGSFEEPVAHNFNRPLFFPFSSELLQLDENAVDVRLYAYAHHYGGLGPVHIGRADMLRPAYERRYLLQVTLSQLTSAIIPMLAIVFVAIWLGTRRDGLYGYFVLATSFWFVASLNYWVRDLPVSHWTWERIVHAAIDGFLACMTLWVHRLVGVRRPRLERVVWAFLAVAVAVAVFTPVAWFYPTVLWVHAASLVWPLYAIHLVVTRFRAGSRWEALVYPAGGALALALGAHDLALQFGAFPGNPYLFPFVVTGVLLAFGTTLTARFVDLLRRAEADAHVLEARVRAREAELAANYRRLQELERERVLSRERQRIMQEMHDGLGGRLVSTLSLVEAGRADPVDVASALRSALDEMRIVIDSLDPDAQGVADLLGMARARLEPVIRRHGLGLRWQLARDLEAPVLSPEDQLHVLRILQEAVTNAIRHSGATGISISTQNENGAVVVEIRDDGRGIAPDARPGRGLANLRARARDLGASLSVRRARPGTVVELRLPREG